MPNALKKPFVNRQTFNPENPAHLASFTYFIQTGNWGDVQFFAELPYNEVPMTCMMKFAEHKLNVTRENQTERIARIAKRPNLTIVAPLGTPAQEHEKKMAALAETNKKMGYA